jgi:hypothetical protein
MKQHKSNILRDRKEVTFFGHREQRLTCGECKSDIICYQTKRHICGICTGCNAKVIFPGGGGR